MNWIWSKLDKKLNKKPEYFLVQTLLAFVSLLAVLGLIGLMGRDILVAALGSSLFIAFLTPESYTAQTRNLIGGHLFAGGIGLGFFYLISSLPAGRLYQITFGALAVALSMFTMVVTDTEHPPAAGTALGLAINGGWASLIFIVLSAAALALIKKLLDPWLADLV